MAALSSVITTEKKVYRKRGTIILSKVLMASILVLASAVIIFLIIRTVLCRTGALSGGVC